MVIQKFSRDLIIRCFFLFLLLTLGSCKSVSADSEGDDWIALNETNLKIAKGSAIDFSEIMPPNVPADNILVGPSGQFVLNNDISNTQRFFCAPYVFSAPHGFFPSKSKIDEISPVISKWL